MLALSLASLTLKACVSTLLSVCVCVFKGVYVGVFNFYPAHHLKCIYTVIPAAILMCMCVCVGRFLAFSCDLSYLKEQCAIIEIK